MAELIVSASSFLKMCSITNPYNFQSKIWNCNIYQSGKKTVKKDKPDSPPPIFS